MTMWPKGLLLVALLGSALADGIPDDVEVVTSTSVSVRVSTSEDHVPRESIINQIVDKDEEKGDTTKKDVTIKEEQKTTLQGQTITVKATTESPKYRVRQKGTPPATTVTAAETTTSTTPVPSTEAPKEPPRRKRKRPAGYRRPEGLPQRKRPEEERRQPPGRPQPVFPQPGPPPQAGIPLPVLPQPALPQHVELNRHQALPSARPHYQSPPPRVPEPLPPVPQEPPAFKRLPVPAPQPEKTEAVHHPQVRPRPVQFEPQLHQALPLPTPQAQLQHNQRPVPSVASVPLPSTVSSQSSPSEGSTSTVPEQPSTKKPLKLKKHRAPDSQKRAQATQITLPPPTKSKVAATTTPAKSSFLSYFSFGKKDEKAQEGASTPLPPVSVPAPAPVPVQQSHQGSVHSAVAPQVRPHYQAEPFQPGPVELSFRESVKQQKFPKTTKTQKPQKNTKKHFRDDYPIPPVVPIPPPRYDEPYRPLESSQPQKSTPTQTSYTAPPPTPGEPVQTTYSAPIETQKPHHHAPNYTPPPSSQPQFLFGYPQDQSYQTGYQQPHNQQYSQPIYGQPAPQQYHHTYATTYQSPQHQGIPHQEPSYQQQQQPQQGVYQQSESQGYQQDSTQSFQQTQPQPTHQRGFQQQQHSRHQQSYEQPQALLVQVPSSVNPGPAQIELPAEMLKALGVKNVAPGVAGSADVSHSQASVVSHLSNGQGVVVLDEISNRPYVRPNSEMTYHHQGFRGDPVPVDVSKTPFTKGLPHGFPAPSKIQVDEKTQVSLSGVVLPHHGLKTSYNELPPTQVNLNEPLNVHIPISQLPPRPAVNVRIKGPNGQVSQVLVPLHESNIKRFPHVGGYSNLDEKPKKYLPPFYGGSSHGKHIQHSFVDQQEFGAPSTSYIRYAQPVQETLQPAASAPQASWIGGWGTSIRNMGSRIGSIFSRKASSS